METKWKLFAGILLVMLLFALSTGPTALADPINNPNTFIGTLQCGSETVTFVVLPAASPTLLDVESTGGFRLTQVDFTIVETGDTGTVPYGAGNGQSRGLQDDLVTCSTTEIRDGLTWVFTLTGFFVPR
jgi:hypothetical protein